MEDRIEKQTAAYVNEFAQSLRKHAQEARARHEAQKAKPAHASGLTPLVDRLRRLIATLPPEVRQQPQSIEFYAERLRGRQKPTPQRAELARCLRQLGYTRSRKWRQSADGFRALWYAPRNGSTA